jgi:hypothetical protein
LRARLCLRHERKIEYWPTLHENIACSGKLLVQPDGNVAPESACAAFPSLEEQQAPQQEMARTLRAFRDAVRNAPGSGAHHFNLGSVLLRMQRPGEAARVLQKALKLGADTEETEELLQAALLAQKEMRAQGLTEETGEPEDDPGDIRADNDGGNGEEADARDDEDE